jgi:hypothetical protein
MMMEMGVIATTYGSHCVWIFNLEKDRGQLAFDNATQCQQSGEAEPILL